MFGLRGVHLQTLGENNFSRINMAPRSRDLHRKTKKSLRSAAMAQDLAEAFDRQSVHCLNCTCLRPPCLMSRHALP